MNKRWRLIIDEKHDGYYNMAVDEAILQDYPFKKIPTLRIYGWSGPFVTLGYRQNPQEVFCPDFSLPFTRRITGGSSIFHHKEITYSICCLRQDLGLPFKVKEAYRKLCFFLVDFYLRLGLEARFAEDLPASNIEACGSFCFSSCEPFDLLIKGKKVGGNAQRRKKELIFQQGSIPQKIDFTQIEKSIKNTSGLKDRTAGLNSLLKKNIGFKTLSASLSESFTQTFKVELIPENLSDRERETAAYLAENKYQCRQWRFNRLAESFYAQTALVE